MAEFRTISLTDITVPERLRAVEEDHALAIQCSIVEHGLINPITVRRTPPATKAFRPYTLVAGAHRLRAIELLDEAEIEAIVVDADKQDAQFFEISENLFRNDLSALDRAVFVMKYRELWEANYGRINPKGGRPRAENAAKIAEFSPSPIDLIADEAAAGFSVNVARRLGVSKRTAENVQQIAQKLRPELRRQLRGTADADNQAKLLKLASLEPAKQTAIASWIADGKDRDVIINEALSKASETVTISPSMQAFDRVVSNWGRMAATEKWKAIETFGLVELLTEDQQAILREHFKGARKGK